MSKVSSPALASASVYGVGLSFAVLSKFAVPLVLNISRRRRSDERITPLCPQLLVRSSFLQFRMDLNEQHAIEVISSSGEMVCKVSIEWAKDLSAGQGSIDVVAIVHLKSKHDRTLATVVFQKIAVTGQGIALCRGGSEIFGFAEPSGENQFEIRHRTGVQLLTLIGSSDFCDVDVTNPVGSRVCTFKYFADGVCHGNMHMDVDAGLVICAFLAAKIHQHILTVSQAPALGDPALTPAKMTGTLPVDTSLDSEVAIPKPGAIEKRNLIPPIFLTIYSGACLGVLLPLLRPQSWVLASGAAVMGALCWLRAGLTDPGGIPEDDPAWAEGGEIVHTSLCQERKRLGARRFCKWTGKYKPDRCHYCRECKKCVLKMDHYSPWISNCVGFRNHRFFVQGLCYQTLWRMTMWASAPLITRFIFDAKQNTRTRCAVCTASISVAIDGLICGGFLALHLWLIKKGMTTIVF